MGERQAASMQGRQREFHDELTTFTMGTRALEALFLAAGGDACELPLFVVDHVAVANDELLTPADLHL